METQDNRHPLKKYGGILRHAEFKKLSIGFVVEAYLFQDGDGERKNPMKKIRTEPVISFEQLSAGGLLNCLCTFYTVHNVKGDAPKSINQ